MKKNAYSTPIWSCQCRRGPGIGPKYNMHDVPRGKALREVFVGPGDITILPFGLRCPGLAIIDRSYIALRDEPTGSGATGFHAVDTAAGIAGNVMYFNMAAKEIVVVITPEPTSLTDGRRDQDPLPGAQ